MPIKVGQCPVKRFHSSVQVLVAKSFSVAVQLYCLYRMKNHSSKHEYTSLEVRRADDQLSFTRDRMRVDVMAEFYVRVKPTATQLQLPHKH